MQQGAIGLEENMEIAHCKIIGDGVQQVFKVLTRTISGNSKNWIQTDVSPETNSIRSKFWSGTSIADYELSGANS